MKYHVNTQTGEAGACSASTGKCPFMAEEEHFSSIEEARAFYESQQEAFPKVRDALEKALLRKRVARSILLEKQAIYDGLADEIATYMLAGEAVPSQLELAAIDASEVTNEAFALYEQVTEEYTYALAESGVAKVEEASAPYRSNDEPVTQLFQGESLELQKLKKLAEAFKSRAKERTALPTAYESKLRAAALGVEAAEAGIATELVQGNLMTPYGVEDHWWIEYEGRIIDPSREIFFREDTVAVMKGHASYSGELSYGYGFRNRMHIQILSERAYENQQNNFKKDFARSKMEELFA